MKNTKRTDVHRPSEIVPADYEWVMEFGRIYYCPASVSMTAEVEEEWEGMTEADTLYTERGAYIHGERNAASAILRCDACGASYVRGSLFEHKPTGELITLGHDCAEALHLAYNEDEARRLERLAREGQARVANLKKKAAERLARKRVLREFVRDNSPELLAALRAEHEIVSDIRRRVIRWGNLSERQAALVLKLAAEANKPAERNVPAPIEEGRQTVEGVVVSTKVHDSAYGSSIKMTVKVETPEGSWLVWGTAPGALLSESHELGHELVRELHEANRDTPDDVCSLKGWRVRFDCKLTAGRDEHFAIFKRPTKAALVSNERHDEVRGNLQVEGGAEPNVWA